MLPRAILVCCLSAGIASPAAPVCCAEVAVATYTLHDTARGRDIPLKAYYPVSGGAYPLIIFSPGYGGSRDGYRYLAQGWAAAGYVVILLSHAGTDTAAIRAHGARELRDPSASTELFAKIAQRPADVWQLIDSLKTVTAGMPGLAGKFDIAHIGMAGHSMGAGTTLYLAGAVMTLPDGSTRRFADPRLKAFIAISPQGPSEEGFTEHSWDVIHAPVLIMAGSHDQGVHGEPASWRLAPYAHLPAGDKYEVVVEGANHFSFTDHIGGLAGLWTRRGETADADAIHAQVLRDTLLFWDAYLKADTAALRQLATATITAAHK